MKLKKLNDNELQIIISHQDLRARNLKKWDLVPYNPHAQDLFQEILEKAGTDCGFEVMQDTQLVVEAYPISEESMIITIRKFHQDGPLKQIHKDALLSDEKVIEVPIALGSEEDRHQTLGDLRIYEFESLDDIIEVSHAIDSYYHGGSRLYKSDDIYHLVLEDMLKLDGSMMGYLIEYGLPTDYSLAFLDEHATQVIDEEAVHKLALV